MAFKLQPNPTFKASVTIPTPDGDGKIVFEFKHKGRKALKEFFASLGEGDAARTIAMRCQDLIAGWSKTSTPRTVSRNWTNCWTTIRWRPKPSSSAYNKGLFEGKEKNSQR
jgi:hypothetical protein